MCSIDFSHPVARVPSLWERLTARVAPKAAIHSPRSAPEIWKMPIENRQLLRRDLRTLSLNGEEIERSNEARAVRPRTTMDPQRCGRLPYDRQDGLYHLMIELADGRHFHIIMRHPKPGCRAYFSLVPACFSMLPAQIE